MDFFTHVTMLTALAVVAVQQLLKLKFIPVAFANRYPVPTLIVLSIAGAIIVSWQTVWPTAWTGWVLLVSTIAVVAAAVYNFIIKNWTQLRSMEGDGK